MSEEQPANTTSWRIYFSFVFAVIAALAGALLLERGIPSTARGMIGAVLLAIGAITFFVTIGVVAGAYDDWF